MSRGIVTVLTRARDLVARPGGWTQEEGARDDMGRPVPVFSPDACSFCSMGAIARACEDRHFEKGWDILRTALGGRLVAPWNDAPERTQAEVVAAFDRAIELAREAGV
ncbi:MAG: hypothetical protein QJR02_15925 [Sinobacteraceae bacterium]|nr:hypothetical protein [Nevskiaceae bacterium]